MNLPLPDREILGLYHAHWEGAQFQKLTALVCGIKTDMNVECPLFGESETNNRVIGLALFVYNILHWKLNIFLKQGSRIQDTISGHYKSS